MLYQGKTLYRKKIQVPSFIWISTHLTGQIYSEDSLIWSVGQALDFRLQTLDFRLWTLDFGLWTLDFRLWTLDFGLFTLDFPFSYLCAGISNFTFFK